MSSPEQLLSRPQRNDVFRTLEKNGALVSEFRMEASSRRVTIWHDSSQSNIDIDLIVDEYVISGTLSNGDPSVTKEAAVERFRKKIHDYDAAKSPYSTWKQAITLIGKWAAAAVQGFKEYEVTPDLWTDFEHSRQLFSAPLDNSPFTEAERELISRQIQQIKAYITTSYELSTDQLSVVNERLDQIEEASHRLGRKDWLMSFSGALFSLILSDVIPQQAAQNILTVALHGLGHLFGLGGFLPPLP